MTGKPQPPKLVCKWGHPLTDDNLEKAALKRGSRRCLICFNAYQEDYKKQRPSRGDYKRGAKPCCKHGHPLVAGNLKGSKRECLTCHRERESRRQRARGIPKRISSLERGVCKYGHVLTADTMRKGRHAGSCAVCHRIRNNGVYNEEAIAYCGVLLQDPCSYCGNPSEAFDHIVPRARGGLDTWENITAACISCNARKHAKSLLRFLCESPPNFYK